MKKNSILKILLGILLLLVVFSYVIPGRSGEVSYLGLADVLLNIFQSYYYFFDTMLFVLLVGGFYGLLNKTRSYPAFIEKASAKISNNKKTSIIWSLVLIGLAMIVPIIAAVYSCDIVTYSLSDVTQSMVIQLVLTILFVLVLFAIPVVFILKSNSNKKRFLFSMAIFLALIASMTGLTLPLFVFIPLVVAIVFAMGYDNIVAMCIGFGSVLIGNIGAILLNFRDPNNSYSMSYITLDEFVGLSDKYVNILPKILLLVVALMLFLYNLNLYIKKLEKNNKKSKKTDEVVVSEKNKSVKIWPMIVMFVVMFVIFVLGFVSWSSLFGIEIFNDFYTWLVGLNIKEFYPFNSIISANLVAFGNWSMLGSYMMPMIMMIVVLVIVIIAQMIKSNKLDDLLDGFTEGAKKLIPSAIVVALAYTVLVCTYNNGFIELCISKAAEKFESVNFAIQSLIVLVGSIFQVDFYYVAAGIFSPIVSVITDSTLLPSLAIIFQGFYGLIMLVGPTSVMLIVGLTYLDIPYTTWIKKIWRLALELFLLIMIVAVLAYYI